MMKKVPSYGIVYIHEFISAEIQYWNTLANLKLVRELVSTIHCKFSNLLIMSHEAINIKFNST